MAQDPFRTLLGMTPEQRIAESYIEQIGRGDQSAARAFDRYLSGQEMVQAQNPMAQRYRQVGEAQTEGLLYDLPETRRIREAEQTFQLEKATAPARAQGAYALEAARIGGQERERTAAANRAAARERAQISQQGQMRRQQNQLLEGRAKEVSKVDPRSWYEYFAPTALGGKPAPSVEAEALRGQQDFGGDEANVAAQFASQFMGASDEEILSALEQEFEADDPSEYFQALEEIRALQRE